MSLRVCVCLLLGPAPPGGRLPPKTALLLLLLAPLPNDDVVMVIVGYHLLTQKHKRTERHMHAQTAKDNRMRANDGHARARQSLFPQHICLGLLFCVPVSMCVSLVGNAASRRAFATENGVVLIVVIGPPSNTETQTNRKTHARTDSKRQSHAR